jgi:hypothetical protein
MPQIPELGPSDPSAPAPPPPTPKPKREKTAVELSRATVQRMNTGVKSNSRTLRALQVEVSKMPEVDRAYYEAKVQTLLAEAVGVETTLDAVLALRGRATVAELDDVAKGQSDPACNRSPPCRRAPPPPPRPLPPPPSCMHVC